MDLLQFKPSEGAGYDAAKGRLEAELAMAEHQKGSAAAWLKAEEMQRERDDARAAARRNGWLAVGGFVLAAASFIYSVLR